MVVEAGSPNGLKHAPALNLIGGQWRQSGSSFAVVDKYTGEKVADAYEATREQVAEAVVLAHAAFERNILTPLERSSVLARTAELVDDHRDEIVDIMVSETGFTVSDAAGDVDRTIVTLRLCAEEATRILGETVSFAASPGQHKRLGFTYRAPLGVICAITPFNSPLNTVAHKIGPALAAGNAVVLKPSQLTPLTATMLCRLMLEAGLPPDLLQLVHGSGELVGEWLLDEPAIAFYAFTGSTEVGRNIQRKAGIRRTQMELGSIASTIVCADADLARAIPKIANASFRKAGQVCTSVQRLYVEESAAGEVLERLVAQAKSMPAGNPRDPAVRVGPMISEHQARRAEQWIEEGKLAQARVLCGGKRAGSVLEPTVLSNVASGMKVVDREIFAPCVVAIPFANIEQASAHANNTPFGLAAGIFTRDIDRALSVARSLRFGAVHINETSSARGDAMPFGGVKDSGFGHEGPRYAIREMTEEKLITFNS